MLLGEHSIVRLCFRFLSCPDPTKKFNRQSREETFTFAVFCGKDSSVNMERNLGSFSVAGEKGWLFEEMKFLCDNLKVHLTLSGDVPWIGRLYAGGITDDQALSTAPIWLPDPDPELLKALCEKNNISSRQELKSKRLTPKLQRELCNIGCILPHVAFYGERNDPKNGYRTHIDASMERKRPECSLAYVKNSSYLCPDGFHQSVRNVEKDFKLTAEYLLEKNRPENFKQLEINTRARGVKHPGFSIPFKEKENLQNAKQIGDLKFSGEDAKVILAHESELEGSGAGPLFENVFYYDRTCPRPLNPLSFKIVTDLHENLETIATEDGDGRTLSERTVVELLFKSHNEIVKFYRNPNKTKDHVAELEKWVETYFQTNMMLFPVDRAFTGYKAKLFVLAKLLRAGNINSLFDHLTEATENSNHGLNQVYHNHTMRDGGHLGNMCSEFEDLFHSFIKAVTLANSRKVGANDFKHLQIAQEPAHAARSMYLEICRRPIPTLELDLGKTENIFASMRFYCILPTTGSFNVKNFEDPIAQKNIVGSKATKTSLHNVVSHLKGGIVTDSGFDTLCEYSELNHAYVVLNDDSVFKQYMNRMKEISQPGWTPAVSTVHPRFLQATRSRFKFVKATYIVDCFHAKQLLSPSLPVYTFEYDRDSFITNSSKALMTRHMERQRVPENETGQSQPVMAKTALKRSRAKARLSAIPTCLNMPSNPVQRVHKSRSRTSNNVTIARTAYTLFYRDYANTQSALYRDATGKVPVNIISSKAASFWAIGECREKWFKQARINLGLPPANPTSLGNI